jgi:hypothetical protein
MDEELIEELDYEIDLLIKSGFFSEDEIFEIIEDEFIDEDVDLDLSYRIGERFSQLTEGLKTSDDFIRLDSSFKQLTQKNVICIHNAGFDIEEGIQDSFELHTHIINNKLEVEGFCFYSFEDIETAIYENDLNIAFGDFELDEAKALEIGKAIAECLKENGFKVRWNETVDEQIVIEDFNWKKAFDERQYSMDGAFEDYAAVHRE